MGSALNIISSVKMTLRQYVFGCYKTYSTSQFQSASKKKIKFQTELLAIFRVYQFCGFSPFPIPFDVNQKPSKSNQYKWLIYNGILAIFFAILVLRNIISYKIFLQDNETQMLMYLNFIVISLMRWLATIIAIESILNSKQQKKFIQKLETIDNIFLNTLNIKPNYKRMRYVSLIWLAIWLIKSVILIAFVMADVIRDDITDWEKFMWFLLTMPLLLTAMRYFQIIQYIRWIGYRCEMINIRLNAIYESTNRLNTGRKIVKTKNSGTRQDKTISFINGDDGIYNDIVSLRQIFHILWECTKLLNKSFRWSLLLLIATSFFVIVVNYYRILVWLLIDGYSENSELVLMYFIWTTGHVFYYIQLSSTCYNVLQQVNKESSLKEPLFFLLTIK